MLRAVVVLTAGLVMGACGGGSKPAAQEPVENKPSSTVAEVPPPPPPQSETERAFAKFAEFEAAMCACTDAECAKRVSDDMTKWSQEEAAANREPVKMTEAETKRATEMGTHMGECMVRAMQAP